MASLTDEQKAALTEVISGYECWIDRCDTLDTEDFWYDFYSADDEAKGLYPGYVGADNDEDGSLFVWWWLGKASEAASLCRAMIEEANNDE